MDIINHLPFNELEERLLNVIQFVASKGVTVIVQPLPFAFDGTEANLADNSQRSRRKGEEPEKVRQVNPFLKRPKLCSCVGQCAETHHRTARQDDFQADHQVGDPAVAGHAVADASLGYHGANDHGGTIAPVVGQHQAMLPQGVVDRVNAGASFGDDVLELGVYLKNFIHPEDIQEDASFKRGADAHTDAAFRDDRDLVFIGETQDLRQRVAPVIVRLHPNNDIRQGFVGPVGE